MCTHCCCLLTRISKELMSFTGFRWFILWCADQIQLHIKTYSDQTYEACSNTDKVKIRFILFCVEAFYCSFRFVFVTDIGGTSFDLSVKLQSDLVPCLLKINLSKRSGEVARLSDHRNKLFKCLKSIGIVESSGRMLE